tara:strand:+ start:8 stop:1072 length:1065 start_codon:yes stop_codon:yes gene_type:complete
MSQNHNFFSNLAFNLAEKNLGKTNKNPSVGCIITKNKSVISSAVTSVNGRPHAEYIALNKKINFENSNMYVTLEPCTHFGLTPPCTNIIKKKRVKNIFYVFEDPDIRTNKKAKKILKNLKKIKIKSKKYKNFYKSYFLNKRKQFPLIDAKIAITRDYFTINKKNKWITNDRSRKVSHLIRSKYDCVVSTSNSINQDNSLLNCRIDGLDNNKPDLIIIDRHLKLKNKLKLFDLPRQRKIYLITLSNNKKKISFLMKKKVKIIKIKSLENKKDFSSLFKIIMKIGKGRILIESGLVFLYQLFKYKLINNLYLFKSSKSLYTKGYNNQSINFIKKLNIKNKINVNLDRDELFEIKIK